MSSVDALLDCLSGKAIVLETHDRVIRSEKESFELPSVITIKKVVNAFLTKTAPCNKKNIYIRDNGKCQYCGCDISYNVATIDHIIPRSRKGKHEWTNVVISCYKCNQKKGDKFIERVGMSLISQPKKVSYPEVALKLDNRAEVWKEYL